MDKTGLLLEKIISWANSEASVRMVIQTGSHGRNDNTADDLSDLDLEIFVDNLKKYSEAKDWMEKIDKVWVYLPLTNSVGDPTRLVIFSDGIKVDFTLNAIQDFDKLVQAHKDSDLFSRGYKVLLDKDSLSSSLSPSSYKNLPTKAPSQEEFTAMVEEFFFEAYHVAKYLKRGSLWAVKFRDWTTKELLLRMIEWYEKSIHGWDYDTWYLGQKIEKWAEKDLYKEFKHIFAHFDSGDSWKALNSTLSLFKRLGQETAKRLGYRYPEQVDKNLTGYIKSLK